MGRYIDPDQPMSDEDKEFLRMRARGDEVIENERRFPPGEKPAEHESEGFMPTKPGYDYLAQAEKTEDAGGRQIERLPVDEAGHPIVPEYGYDDADSLGQDDSDDLDDDILEKVLDMNVEELEDELEKLGLEKSGNKEELVDRLANALQDKRDAENASTD